MRDDKTAGSSLCGIVPLIPKSSQRYRRFIVGGGREVGFECILIAVLLDIASLANMSFSAAAQPAFPPPTDLDSL